MICIQCNKSKLEKEFAETWQTATPVCLQCVDKNIRTMGDILIASQKVKEDTSKGGTKHDQSKPDLSLIPREPLWELARVLMAGEKKYGRWNWQDGIDIHRLTSAAMRHITQFNDGETIDEETKTNHLLNASANLFFAYWMLQNKPEHDTRPKKK